ncbi:MAG: D-cysteine desulfhydrase family protein [Pseudomonadota bacterium]
MSLGRFESLPVVDLGYGDTPLEPLPQLSKANRGAQIWAKRDDAQALAFGGNKVRQVGYYMGAAQAQCADTVLITGAVQSNYCRTAAAFAAKLGMKCHIQQEARVASEHPGYKTSGNVLVSQLLGAALSSYPHGEDEAGADAELERLAETYRKLGRRPYVVHLGPGHPPIGALGYVACAKELLGQINALNLSFDHIAVPSGSGATHAGFLFGLRALGCKIPVTGYCVRRAEELQKPRLIARCAEIAELLEIANPVADDDVVINDRFLLPGYGQLNLPTERAISLSARSEALILDPVYSGKCMAGALNIAGNLRPDQNVLFLHTGGSPAIFAYQMPLSGGFVT